MSPAASTRAILRQCSRTGVTRALPNQCRRLHTASLTPAVRHLVRDLFKRQPCYAVSSSNVHILGQPQAFYKCVLNMIRRARRRICISSLYIGSEDLELVKTLHESLHVNPSLQVHMHLDYNRCTRPEALSTANMLLPLLREFPERVHVWLFRSPNLKGLMAKLMPPRFNEGWGGTWHPKIYGADDEILISGANLNTSYFTNRQDRYIHFAAQPALAQYCFSFLEQASVFSYELLPAPSPSEGYILHWSDERTHPHHTEQKAENALKSFQRARLAESRTTLSSTPAGEPDPATGSDSDVLIFPIIQAGQFHIREEEECLDMLFRYISPPEASPVDTPLVDLTSGYFGLYKPYQEQLIKANIAARVLAASPKANGFYASKGVSGRIPEGYTVLERRFMKAVRAAGREWPHDTRITSTGVQLSEWERDGWTYHAKGIWLRPTQVEDPVLTLFGSTNLNSRSANLDTELSFMLVTTSPVLRARLAQEVDGLRAHALPWQGDKRTVRPVSWLLASALCNRL